MSAWWWVVYGFAVFGALVWVLVASMIVQVLYLDWRRRHQG